MVATIKAAISSPYPTQLKASENNEKNMPITSSQSLFHFNNRRTKGKSAFYHALLIYPLLIVLTIRPSTSAAPNFVNNDFR